MIYVDLFLSFFQIGLFSIGGGYAAIPLIQDRVVNNHHWLTMTEFTDLITIAEMTPGPIAINSSTFVGTQIAGPLGGFIATLGCIFPSCIIVLTLAYLYSKYQSLSLLQGILSGLRPAIVALIGSAGLSILVLAFWGGKRPSLNISSFNFLSGVLFFFALVILRKYKPNPILVILGCGLIGGIFHVLSNSVL